MLHVRLAWFPVTLTATQPSLDACRYVFLVDGAGRVRWRGSGPPTPNELAGFLAAAEQLAQGTTLGPRPPPRLP